MHVQFMNRTAEKRWPWHPHSAERTKEAGRGVELGRTGKVACERGDGEDRWRGVAGIGSNGRVTCAFDVDSTCDVSLTRPPSHTNTNGLDSRYNEGKARGLLGKRVY